MGGWNGPSGTMWGRVDVACRLNQYSTVPFTSYSMRCIKTCFIETRILTTPTFFTSHPTCWLVIVQEVKWNWSENCWVFGRLECGGLRGQPLPWFSEVSFKRISSCKMHTRSHYIIVKWSEVKWKVKSEKWKWSESIFGPLFFFNFRYIKVEVWGNNNIDIKKCTTIFLWVLNLGQVGELPQRFSKSHHYGDFFQKWSPTCRSKRVFLRPNFRINFFSQKI